MLRRWLYAETDTGREAFEVVIHDPAVCGEGGNTYACKIKADGLLGRPVQIYGEGAAQAAELAKRFLNIRPGDVPANDEAGERILSIEAAPKAKPSG